LLAATQGVRGVAGVPAVHRCHGYPGVGVVAGIVGSNTGPQGMAGVLVAHVLAPLLLFAAWFCRWQGGLGASNRALSAAPVACMR
jgi:hypothetical protein